MKKLEIKPFQLGESNITSVELKPISFSKMASVQNAVAPKGGKRVSAILRERMKVQIILKSGDKVIPLDDKNIAALPYRVGNELVYALVNSGEGDSDPVGEIITEGDGFDTPILYKLGTPIKFQGGKEIIEIEFIARSFGDVEDIMGAIFDGTYEATLALLDKVAVPLGIDTLKSLPSSAVEAVSLSDGIKIMTDILPVFLKGAED